MENPQHRPDFRNTANWKAAAADIEAAKAETDVLAPNLPANSAQPALPEAASAGQAAGRPAINPEQSPPDIKVTDRRAMTPERERIISGEYFKEDVPKAVEAKGDYAYTDESGKKLTGINEFFREIDKKVAANDDSNWKKLTSSFVDTEAREAREMGLDEEAVESSVEYAREYARNKLAEIREAKREGFSDEPLLDSPNDLKWRDEGAVTQSNLNTLPITSTTTTPELTTTTPIRPLPEQISPEVEARILRDDTGRIITDIDELYRIRDRRLKAGDAHDWQKLTNAIEDAEWLDAVADGVSAEEAAKQARAYMAAKKPVNEPASAAEPEVLQPKTGVKQRIKRGLGKVAVLHGRPPRPIIDVAASKPSKEPLRQRGQKILDRFAIAHVPAKPKSEPLVGHEKAEHIASQPAEEQPASAEVIQDPKAKLAAQLATVYSELKQATNPEDAETLANLLRGLNKQAIRNHTDISINPTELDVLLAGKQDSKRKMAASNR